MCLDLPCFKLCLPVPQGNLSEFVKVRPEARSYYELSAAKLKFNLPKPGFLDGVKSRVRRICFWHTSSISLGPSSC